MEELGRTMITATVPITEEQNRVLERISKNTGKSETELLSEAIEQYVRQAPPPGESSSGARMDREKQLAALRGVCGMWKDRYDLPDFEQMRKDWDRRLERF